MGLLWPPEPRRGHSAMAVRNRPPTRMHWWFAQGIPVIAYPMPAYVDAARRINYPAELVMVNSSKQLERSFCLLASLRKCASTHASSLIHRLTLLEWSSRSPVPPLQQAALSPRCGGSRC